MNKWQNTQEHEREEIYEESKREMPTQMRLSDMTRILLSLSDSFYTTHHKGYTFFSVISDTHSHKNPMILIRSIFAKASFRFYLF